MGQDYEVRKKGLRVEVRNNNITKAWRKLKRRLQDEGITQELRERRFYEKPSEKRNRKKAIAIKRWEKKRDEIADKI
jgi:small subunit ribosomal protein S21|tara:strand:- start:517 stop:747 length:231 start_codon:yes stop_codon:yes gene_type:complete